MTRFVRPRPPGGIPAGDQEIDRFQDRLLKYIPAELISTYTACVAAFASMRLDEGNILALLICIAVVFCALIIIFTEKFFGDGIPDESAAGHRIASSVSFLAWAYSISGAALPSYYNGGLALLLMALSALFAWLVWPEAKTPSQP